MPSNIETLMARLDALEPDQRASVGRFIGMFTLSFTHGGKAMANALEQAIRNREGAPAPAPDPEPVAMVQADRFLTQLHARMAAFGAVIIDDGEILAPIPIPSPVIPAGKRVDVLIVDDPTQMIDRADDHRAEMLEQWFGQPMRNLELSAIEMTREIGLSEKAIAELRGHVLVERAERRAELDRKRALQRESRRRKSRGVGR